MILGSIMLRLEAETPASLPLYHGRLLHGALFALIRERATELAAHIHDKMNIKPFTVSMLECATGAQTMPALPRGGRLSGRGKRGHGARREERLEERFTIACGERYCWRIGVLSEEVARVLLELPPGTRVAIGDAKLVLREIITDGAGLGLVSAEDMMAAVFGCERIERLRFLFTSPVAFRVGTRDYPLPTPELVFGSLADKWRALGLPAVIERGQVVELAREVVPLEWHGGTERVYLSRDRGVLAFSGSFAYDVTALGIEERQILLLLAQLAQFAGVGRLTAQGLGEVRLSWR